MTDRIGILVSVGFALIANCGFLSKTLASPSGTEQQKVAVLFDDDCPGKDQYEAPHRSPDNFLLSGDRIKVTGAQCKVSIVYFATRPEKSPKDQQLYGSKRNEDVLEQRHGSYVVASVKVDGLVGKIAMTVLGAPPEPKAKAHDTSARTGGDDLAIPLLELWNSHISSGNRPLYLAWQEGKGPYDVILAPKNRWNEPLASARNIAGHSIRFDNMTLQAGTYVVSIRDKEGRSVQADFMAVSPSKIPTPPSEIQSSNTHLLTAGWLASSGHGEYVFEAYQRISALSDDDKLARRIRGALERGWRPALND